MLAADCEETCYFAVCGRRWCEATRRVVERGACVSVCQLVETRFSEEFRGRGQRARSQRAHPARTQRNWEKQKPCPPAVGIVDWLCWLRACHKRRDHSSPARYPRGLSLDRIALQVTLGRFTAMQLAWPRPHITHRRDDLTETYLLGVLGEYPTTTMVAVGAEPDTPQYQLQQVTCFKGSKQLLPRMNHVQCTSCSIVEQTAVLGRLNMPTSAAPSWHRKLEPSHDCKLSLSLALLPPKAMARVPPTRGSFIASFGGDLEPKLMY